MLTIQAAGASIELERGRTHRSTMKKVAAKEEIRTSDGHLIQALTHRSPKSRSAVVLCHGITSEKTEGGLFIQILEEFARRDVSVVTFDFRGHGDSPISAIDGSITGMALDLATVLQKTQSEYPNVSLASASFGASICLLLGQAGELGSIAKSVFWNPVTSYESTFVHSTTPWGRSFFPPGGLVGAGAKDCVLIGTKKHAIGRRMLLEICLLRPEFAVWQASPLLVMHGALDSVVSLTDSRSFVSRHSGYPITLREFPHADHGLEGDRDEAVTMTIEFICEAR